MLGHRGCRLGITYPEIYGMQVRAIMEAACTAAAEGVTVEPEIMIPLTGTIGEMRLTYAQTKRVADGIIAEMGVAVKYLIGTMIEVPRAALIAGEPASVEFCHKVGMTYVSCSPFMIPIARLSAAQARIRARQASEGSPNG